eukprot:2956464-Pyramimonas_sp.AAC.1
MPAYRIKTAQGIDSDERGSEGAPRDDSRGSKIRWGNHTLQRSVTKPPIGLARQPTYRSRKIMTRASQLDLID